LNPYARENRMSDKMRHRYGETNAVDAAVDSKPVIEIGDLVWLDRNRARPASDVNRLITPNPFQQFFAEKFLGVAMQRSCYQESLDIEVATTGVFEFDCCLRRWELGDLVGAIPNDTGKLQDQAVGQVDSSRCAIGRVAKREASAVSSVLIDIRSTVMTGGVEGSSRDGV
jgi:hypothetical protein